MRSENLKKKLMKVCLHCKASKTNNNINIFINKIGELKMTIHVCYQLSTRPDPQFASSYHYHLLESCFVLVDFEKWGRTDVQTTCAKIVITT